MGGGDEFVILISHITIEDDIKKIICRIFEALKIPLVFEIKEIRINVSIGISIFFIGYF